MVQTIISISSILIFIASILFNYCHGTGDWEPDQFFMMHQPTSCTPDGKVWIFEYLGFWYQSPEVCYRYLLRAGNLFIYLFIYKYQL